MGLLCEWWAVDDENLEMRLSKGCKKKEKDRVFSRRRKTRAVKSEELLLCQEPENLKHICLFLAIQGIMVVHLISRDLLTQHSLALKASILRKLIVLERSSKSRLLNDQARLGILYDQHPVPSHSGMDRDRQARSTTLRLTYLISFSSQHSLGQSRRPPL